MNTNVITTTFGTCVCSRLLELKLELWESSSSGLLSCWG